MEILQTLLAQVRKPQEEEKEEEEKLKQALLVGSSDPAQQDKPKDALGVKVAKFLSGFEGNLTILIWAWVRLYYHGNFSSCVVVPAPSTFDKFNTGTIGLQFYRVKIELPDRGIGGLRGELKQLKLLESLWKRLKCCCNCAPCSIHQHPCRETLDKQENPDEEDGRQQQQGLSRNGAYTELGVQTDDDDDDDDDDHDAHGSRNAECSCPFLSDRPRDIQMMAKYMAVQIQTQIDRISIGTQDSNDKDIYGTDVAPLRQCLACAQQREGFIALQFPTPDSFLGDCASPASLLSNKTQKGKLTYVAALHVKAHPGMDDIDIVPLLEMSRHEFLEGVLDLKWNSWANFNTDSFFITQMGVPNQKPRCCVGSCNDGNADNSGNAESTLPCSDTCHECPGRETQNDHCVTVNQPVTCYVFWQAADNTAQEFKPNWKFLEHYISDGWEPQQQTDFSNYGSEFGVVLAKKYDTGEIELERIQDFRSKHYFFFIVAQQVCYFC